jgi:signal peptidase II
MVALTLLDQLTKLYFTSLDASGWSKTVVIEGFFYFTHTINRGAAFSFLAGNDWGQIFLKIFTLIALIAIGFFIYYVYFRKKKDYLFLAYSLSLILGGLFGNFIDRLYMNGVVDFIGFIFGSYYFPVFNVADICLTVGVIMFFIHFFFLDENAILKKKEKDENKNANN